MKRTARLVRLALEGRAPAPEPWLRGGADVAAAVAKSGANSRREGAPAAGGRGGGIPSRDPSHTAGAPSGVPGRQLAHAAGGPGAFSSRDIAHAAGGPGAISPHDVIHAAGGQAAISPHDVIRAAGGPGVFSSRDIAHAAGGPGAISPLHVAHAAGGQAAISPHDVVHAEAKDIAVGTGCFLSLAASSTSSHGDTDPSCSGSSSSKVRHLTVHDKIFAVSNKLKLKSYDMDDLSGEDDWQTNIDVSDQITSFLTNSAAPVLSFRIDCSKWTKGTCLEQWLDMLSERSVQELDILNLGHPGNTEFPIQNVQSKNLQVFRLGFLALQLDLHCFDYRALHTLEFFSCAFESNKLSWIITDCLTLKVLKLYYCYGDLRIESTSLQVLDCFGHIGNRIVIVSAPRLQSLGCGMMAIQKSQLVRQRVSVSVSLSDVPMLKVIKHLILPYHKISLNSKELTKDCLPTIKSLNLSLEMADSIQLQKLRKLLESFPNLQDLSVKRLDGIGRDESFDIRIDEPFSDLENVDCINNCLTTFVLLEFRGGSAEMHIIQSLLKNARNLKLLWTSSCGSVSKGEIRQIREAVNQMKSYDRASKTCQLIFE